MFDFRECGEKNATGQKGESFYFISFDLYFNLFQILISQTVFRQAEAGPTSGGTGKSTAIFHPANDPNINLARRACAGRVVADLRA